MYNNVYQDYINNMIGTMPRDEMEFLQMNAYSNLQETSNIELEQLYPDVYKLLYPMIQAACIRNTRPITKETIDEMVNEIYSNFNDDNTTKPNINLSNEIHTSSSNNSKTEKTSKTLKNQEENRQIRRPNNYMLNDLIRILLIRELLRRPGGFPPNRPGFPPPRPPFRPRNMQTLDYNIYEEPIDMYSNYNNFTTL